MRFNPKMLIDGAGDSFDTPVSAPKTYAPNPLDIRDPSTRRTPAQIAAQEALAEAVAAGRDLGIITRTNVS